MTEHIVVIGGSSGMGLAVARRVVANGGTVVIVGRSSDRLSQARDQLGAERVETATADITQRAALHTLFERLGTFDHLVVTAADLAYGPLQSLGEADLLKGIRSKVLGPIFAAQEAAPRLRPGGSITFTSGIAARRPLRGGLVAATVNAGLEGLTRALAIELAPIRVNAVSPGWVDTPIWDTLPGLAESKNERFAAMAGRLPVGRIGHVDDVADAILFLMHNGFTTGSILEVDGGHQLV